ncbi:flippase [Pelagicoccus sp. SDUM812003]|uniref:flippase n=1 Tax=Pelagicoccus sp. SDUM812003 TaxID=3041267 RepID=UPI00280F96F3|nr:flippase [Pelagicoccus sp. SDUM812003]MDQ8202371.1 flippase [Pelagicoccus sp. SDUM812003]
MTPSDNPISRIVKNVSILGVSKLLRIGLGFVITAYVARNLGTDLFGTLSYAFAIVSLGHILCSLGIESIARRELNIHPKNEPELIGTAIYGQFLVGAAGTAFLGALAFLFQSGDEALTLFFAAFTLLATWNTTLSGYFQNVLQGKSVAIAQLSSFAISASLKLYLILIDSPVWAFAAVESLESILIALCLAYLYHRGRSFHRLRWRFARFRKYVADSWPAALSGFVIIVYMRIDQIMLKELLGTDAVGIYSAALRFSEIWAFIPTFIATSALSTLMAAKEDSPQRYRKVYGSFIETNLALALLIACGIFIIAPAVVSFFLGIQYSDTTPIVRIHVWSLIFIFVGVSRSQHFLAENLLRHSLAISILGALINIVLNWFWIRSHGIAGAAWSTVVSQAIVALVGPLLFARTRDFGLLVLRSLLFPNLRLRLKTVRPRL